MPADDWIKTQSISEVLGAYFKHPEHKPARNFQKELVQKGRAYRKKRARQRTSGGIYLHLIFQAERKNDSYYYREKWVNLNRDIPWMEHGIHHRRHMNLQLDGEWKVKLETDKDGGLIIIVNNPQGVVINCPCDPRHIILKTNRR